MESQALFSGLSVESAHHEQNVAAQFKSELRLAIEQLVFLKPH